MGINELDILKWIAGGNQDISNIQDVNQEILLELLDRHQLTGRARDRFTDKKYPWCNQHFLMKIDDLHNISVSNTTLQLEVTSEINAAIGQREKPIFIKGFNDYLLSQKEASIRKSRDIDIIYNDIEFINDVLLSLGFMKNGETSNGMSSLTTGHEAGSYCRNDVAIDLHRYFPIAQYPEGIGEVFYKNRLNNYLKQDTSIEYLWSKICYEDLYQKYTINYNSSILIPDLHACVLISCCHLFRTFTKFGSKPGLIVKLAELASIKEITETSMFDEILFEKLVNELNCTHSVQFVCYLLDRYYNYVPAKLINFFKSESKGLLNRNYLGIWGYFEEEHELITPHDTNLEFRRIMSKVGGSQLIATAKSECSKNIYQLYDDTGNLKDLMCLIVSKYDLQQTMTNIEVDIQYDQNNIYFHISIPTIPSGFEQLSIKLYFRHPLKTSTTTTINTNNIDEIITNTFEVNYSYCLDKLSKWNDQDSVYAVLEMELMTRSLESIKTIIPLNILLKEVVECSYGKFEKSSDQRSQHSEVGI